MKTQLSVLTCAIACFGLAACAVPPGPNDLSQQTVQYNCASPAGQPLSAQYTFQGEEPASVRIIYQNQAIDLVRDVATRADMVGNTFRGSGYTWTTDSFDVNTVNRAGNRATGAYPSNDPVTGSPIANPRQQVYVNPNGSMLTRLVPQTVNGQTTTVNTIIANQCRAIGTVAPVPPLAPNTRMVPR